MNPLNHREDLIARIVVAMDFSDCAARALGYGCFLAASYSARLNLVHVLEAPYDILETKAYAEFLRRRDQMTEERMQAVLGDVHQTGLPAERTVVLGIASERIVETAEHWQADLIVQGTYGWTGLKHIALGSTAERVIRAASCPVLTVRCGREGLEAREPVIQSILVPIDFSQCSRDAFQYAVYLARHFKANMMLLHVIEPIYYDLDLGLGPTPGQDAVRTQWNEKLQALAASVKSHGLSIQTGIRGGIPADSILAAALEQKSDVIVMGTHGRRGVSPLSGSVAEAVLRRATCPVISLRTALGRPEITAAGAA